MATAEARTLLDQLMGNDRNAVLPKGAALPNKRKSDGPLMLRKKQKSCFDPDIDPFYTAWGIDVYDLFVNTKSDLGINPNVVDDAAHQEYLQLPKPKQEELGYHFRLFQKLSELVKQCERIVSRNKEKLRAENARLGITDAYLDDGQVEALVVAMIRESQAAKEVTFRLPKLEQSLQEQAQLEETLKPLQETADPDNTQKAKLVATRTERDAKTLQTQAHVHAVARALQNYGVYRESVQTQRAALEYQPEIGQDKTVCEVSGNFMSSRDADERIAAHYAGKQYVGWKLVRDKHQAMVKQFGSYGPPPPPRRREPPREQYHRGGGGGGGYDRGRGGDNHRGGGGGYDRRGGGDYHRGGGGGYDRGGGGGYDRGGGGGYDRGGRWERGGGYNNYDRRGPPPRRDYRR